MATAVMSSTNDDRIAQRLHLAPLFFLPEREGEGEGERQRQQVKAVSTSPSPPPKISPQGREIGLVAVQSRISFKIIQRLRQHNSAN